MQNPLSPFAKGLPAGIPQPTYTRTVKQTESITSKEIAQKRYNPFMAAMNSDTPEFREMYGVNKPLAQPMFLGYNNDQPMYGGTKLFLLY